MHYSAFMDSVDLNLLTALDVLLTGGQRDWSGSSPRPEFLRNESYTHAASSIQPVDPLLVRAGRGLVPTPHAVSLYIIPIIGH